MSRRGIQTVAFAFTVALIAPSAALAYFPPEIGMPPLVINNVPPDPFGQPEVEGLGEPEIPDPGVGPSVQTPEPASIITAITGLAMAGGFAWRKRAKAVAFSTVSANS